VFLVGSLVVALITTKPKFEEKHGRLLKILSRFGALLGFLISVTPFALPNLLTQPTDTLPKENTPTFIQAEYSIEPPASTATPRSWGPTDRVTFPWDNPADYITFNSIRNNPEWKNWTGTGDERNFVAAKPVGDLTYDNFDALMEKDTLHTFSPDLLAVEDGKEYFVMALVCNDMKSSLPNNIAENVKASAEITSGSAKEHAVRVDVMASNAIYKRADDSVISTYGQPIRNVHDDVIFAMDRDFTLSYVAGSAKYYTNAATFSLSDDLYTKLNGTKLGYDQLDGRINGCWEYRGLIFFRVRVKVC